MQEAPARRGDVCRHGRQQTPRTPCIAFDGFKPSGIGRDGDTQGLPPYLESKTPVLDGMPKSIGRVVLKRIRK